MEGRVVILAWGNIKDGEEFSFDVGLMYEERYAARIKAEYACWCGAASCRGTMLAPKRRRR